MCQDHRASWAAIEASYEPVLSKSPITAILRHQISRDSFLTPEEEKKKNETPGNLEMSLQYSSTETEKGLSLVHPVEA